MSQLQQIIAELAIPGLPGWTGLLSLLLLGLLAAAFLAMPFSVFGIKARLDMLEAQLDEIQAEIRAQGTRRPQPNLPGLPESLADPLARPELRPEPRLDWPAGEKPQRLAR